jgi:hypothetical protein
MTGITCYSEHGSFKILKKDARFPIRIKLLSCLILNYLNRSYYSITVTHFISLLSLFTFPHLDSVVTENGGEFGSDSASKSCSKT